MVKPTTFSSATRAHSVPLRLLVQLMQGTAENHAWKKNTMPYKLAPGSDEPLCQEYLLWTENVNIPGPVSTQACFLVYGSQPKCRKIQAKEGQGMCPGRNHTHVISIYIPSSSQIFVILYDSLVFFFFLSGLIFEKF